jgi:site-specific recombinase XerC
MLVRCDTPAVMGNTRDVLLPPASWLQQIDAALRGRGFRTESLVDRDQAFAAWFAAGQSPRVASRLDAVDAALARWLAPMKPITRITYQANLRAVATALGFQAPRPVRAMLDVVIAKPAAMDKRLEQFKKATEWKAGTLRGRLSALHRASDALVAAKLAVRTVAGARPHYDEGTVRSANADDVEAIDALLRTAAGPVAARTRAVLHLAWCAALAPRELLQLQHENVHLARRALVRGRERIPLDRDAVDAVTGWLAHRGRTAGPLLIALEGKAHRPTNRTITARELQRSFAKYARAAGVDVTLSGLRNGAVLLAASVRGRQTAQRLAGTDDRGLVNRLIRHSDSPAAIR